MANKFLVVRHWESDPVDEDTSEIMTAAQIFDYMDMEDCFPEELFMDIWLIKGWGEAPVECSFLGTWHDPSDPLKMEIRWDGGCAIGYGTDH